MTAARRQALSIHMDSTLLTEIGDAERLAVEYCAKELRPALTAFFAFDARLGQIASKTTEPALGQMRLAWWRDTLSQPVDDRPSGDVVLEAASQQWAGLEASLIEAVDAWEVLIASEILSAQDIELFAEGRARPIVRIGHQVTDKNNKKLKNMAELWALADIAHRVSDEDERATILGIASERLQHTGPITKSLRGIAVLNALARRSLARGGQAMLEGRGAALTALRVGLIGR